MRCVNFHRNSQVVSSTVNPLSVPCSIVIINLMTCFQKITHTWSSRSRLRRWYRCQVMNAGPLCEKSMALNGRPGPTEREKTNSTKSTSDFSGKHGSICGTLINLFQHLITKNATCSFTEQSVADGVVMLPDKQVVDGDVGDLGLGSIWTQESQPVLCGNDIVWVDGGLSQFQSIEELLELLRGQGVDVLPQHRGFPLVTV